MQESRIDFKKLRSVISYGIELNETSLTILTILLQEVKRQFVPIHTKLNEWQHKYNTLKNHCR